MAWDNPNGRSEGLEEAAAGNLICTSSKVTLRSVSSSSSTICVPSAVVDGQQLICLASGWKKPMKNGWWNESKGFERDSAEGLIPGTCQFAAITSNGRSSEPSGLHPLIDARLPKTTGRSACPRTKSSSSQCFIWDQEHSGLVTQWLARLGKRTLARSLRCCSCTSQILPDLGLPEYHEIEHVSGPRTFFAKCHCLDRFAGNWAPSCHFTRGTGALAR